MSNESEDSQLLRIAISLLARHVFSPEALRKIVAPTSKSTRQLKAYNLCDGTRIRSEVAKASGLDKDNFNKAVNRWISEGVVFEMQQGDRRPLLHLYPLPAKPPKESTGNA